MAYTPGARGTELESARLNLTDRHRRPVVNSSGSLFHVVRSRVQPCCISVLGVIRLFHLWHARQDLAWPYRSSMSKGSASGRRGFARHLPRARSNLC